MNQQQTTSCATAKEAVFASVREEIAGSQMDLGNPVEFARLVEIAAAASVADEAPSADCIRILAAMALLGPDVGLPTDDDCVSLEGLASRYCPDGDEESVLDIVAAFGCR